LSKAIPTNTAASAKQRLLNRARAKKEDFNLLLTKYALERVLYRVSQSHRDTLFRSRPMPENGNLGREPLLLRNNAVKSLANSEDLIGTKSAAHSVIWRK
jgi:hypothetical protein